MEEIKKDLIDLILHGEDGESAWDLDFSFRVRTILEENVQYPPLFRYCSADYNNIRALETKRIYLSSIGNQNDAFEGLSSITTFKKDYRIDELAYIKSFTENYNDLTMWGLYADSFRGICVEYDINKLKGTPQEHLLYHLFPVAYNDERKEIYNYKTIHDTYLSFKEAQYSTFKYDVDFSDIKNILPLFLVKSTAWQREREWRLVTTLEHLYSEYEPEENDPEWLPNLYKIKFYCGQYIDFDCVKSITLGPNMDECKKEHLKTIGFSLGIPVIETVLSKRRYEIIRKEQEN